MSSIVTGVKWVALETVVSRALQIISVLYVARVLGPEAMGTVALIVVALEIFNLFSKMGITQAIIHYKSPTSRQLATLYSINWILAAFVYGIIFLTAPFVAGFYEKESLAGLLPIAGLAVFINAAGQQTLALLQKELLFKVASIVAITGAFVNVTTTVVMVTLEWGIWSIVFGQLAGLLVRNGLALAYAVANGLFSGFGACFREVQPLLSFGLYQTGAMSMNMINSRADQLIIGKTIGAAGLGLYSIGSQITLQAMQQINSIGTKVAFPGVAKNQDNVNEVKKIYLVMIANVLLVSAPLFIGLAALSPLFVEVVLGNKWSGLDSVLSILCGYVLIRSLGNMNSPLAMGLGKANWVFYWNLGLLFVIPSIVFLSSLTQEIEVVAISLLASQLVLVVVAYFYWIRPLIGACAMEYLITVGQPVFCAGVMGLFLLAAHEKMGFQENAVTLSFLVFWGVLIYAALSLVFNRRNTLQFLKHIWAPRLRQ